MPLVPQRPVHPAGSPAEAIIRGYFAQVRFLLEMSGPSVPNRQADLHDPDSGRTPLALCALVRDRGWSLSLARLLLEKGAKVGLKDRRGMNALHYACAHGRDQLAELYLQAIDYPVNDMDCYRNTAMHYAVRSGRPVIVAELLALLKRLQLPVSPPNKEGVTPLMLAYMGGHVDIAEQLLAAGADATAVDAFGKATSVYQRECQERLRAAAEAKEAKAAGRKLRFDDLDGWRRYQTRLRSAPIGGRHPAGRGGGGGSVGGATFKEAQREHRRARMYQPDEADLISAASILDRHNNPAEVFRKTPTDLFGPAAAAASQQLSITGLGLTRNRVRAHSALPDHGRSSRARGETAVELDDSDNDSDRSKDSREIKNLSRIGSAVGGGQRGGGGGGDSWSNEMVSSMFRNYEYHCSTLYRPLPRVPDPVLYVQDFAARFLMPPQTDAEAGGNMDTTTIGGRRRKGEAAAAAAARKGKRGIQAAAASASAAAAAVGAFSSSDAAAKRKTGGGGTGGGGAGRISRATFAREE